MKGILQEIENKSVSKSLHSTVAAGKLSALTVEAQAAATDAVTHSWV